MEDLQNVLLRMAYLVPQLSQKGHYKEFLSLKKQLDKILKKNSVLNFDSPSFENVEWEVEPIEWK